jgi:hypothetical protein
MLKSVITLLSTNFFSQNNSNNYLGSKYLGNYVWAGAINLAWDELNENILHDNYSLIPKSYMFYK